MKNFKVLTPSIGAAIAVQTHLFKLGVKWLGEDMSDPNDGKFWDDFKEETAIVFDNGALVYNNYYWSEEVGIALEDVFRLTEDDFAPTEKVELNHEYSAIVSAQTIMVGCQTFDIDVLDKLIAARKKVLAAQAKKTAQKTTRKTTKGKRH